MKTSASILAFLLITSSSLTLQASAAEGQPFRDLQRQIDVLKAEVRQLREDIQSTQLARTYSAAGCTPQIPFWLPNVIYNPQGVSVHILGAGNSVQLQCPIVRTSVGSQNGARVDVVIARRGPNVDIPAFCILQSHSSDGFETIDSDGEAASLAGVLSVVIQLQVTKSEPDGYFELHCSVPDNFLLVQYTVREP